MASKGAMIWGRASTRATSMPRWRSCSAISTPMKPAPQTTARRAEEEVIQALMRSMSSRLRRLRLPGRSMPVFRGLCAYEEVFGSAIEGISQIVLYSKRSPAMGGLKGMAPRDKIKWSYGCWYSLPVPTSRTVTDFAALSILVTSVNVDFQC
jgi:hypothetical protein